jgi:thiamine-monophosphate kinase
MTAPPEPLPFGATVGAVGERALLARLRARIPPAADVPVGPGDDAALLRTTPLTVLTTDAMVENVHFRRDWTTARRIGRKALAVNLSDVGAMAGRPRFVTVSLCLPRSLEVAWLDSLYDGLLERAGEAEVAIVGGNLSGIDGPLVIDVAALGEAPARPLLRRGARPGDRIVVTGTLGAAALGLDLVREGVRLREDDGVKLPAGEAAPSAAEEDALVHCLRAQLDPEPPLGLAADLAAVMPVHAGMDLSDGLSGDLLALCTESGVAAHLKLGSLPKAPGAEALGRWGAGDPLEAALHGGEDYQLLLAVSQQGLLTVASLAERREAQTTVIGTFVAGPPGVWIEERTGLRPLAPRAHEHFAPRGGGS